jgi:hypothetical protein
LTQTERALLDFETHVEALVVKSHQEKPTYTMPPTPTDDLTERGLALYERDLKPLLEPKYDGQFVAIHVDSGDYEVARSSADAMRAILKRHSIDGRLVMRKIGDEPEYGLASRIIAGEMLGAQRK